jgi:hypothetical protein
MFQAVAILIVVAGTFAIVYTIFGAATGRGLTIGLVLAGCILAVQAMALLSSAIVDRPAPKPDASEAPASSPDAASAGLSLVIS